MAFAALTVNRFWLGRSQDIITVVASSGQSYIWGGT
jgi:hypothetical protein